MHWLPSRADGPDRLAMPEAYVGQQGSSFQNLRDRHRRAVGGRGLFIARGF